MEELTTKGDIEDPDRLTQLGDFCRKMGNKTNQGEIGMVIGNEYFAFQDFDSDEE